MRRFSRIVLEQLLVAAFCIALAQQMPAQTSIRTVKVLGAKDAVEVEVDASDPIVPQSQVLSGPDRLVIDFPNAVPSGQLRNQSVDLGEVKDLRFGLFQAKPPVTRLVLDLKTAQSYQVFPYGRTVMIKIANGSQNTSVAANGAPSGPTTRPGFGSANYATAPDAIRVEAPVKPPLEVFFRNGLLGIKADKVTLSEVLEAVHQRTGAEISLAPGAEQETVVTDIGPAPAAEVLARLLNGSRFNFLILSAVNNPQQLDRVILTVRPQGSAMPPPLARNTPSNDVSDDEGPTPLPGPPEPPARAMDQRVPGPLSPASMPEMRAPGDNPPNQ